MNATRWLKINHVKVLTRVTESWNEATWSSFVSPAITSSSGRPNILYNTITIKKHHFRIQQVPLQVVVPCLGQDDGEDGQGAVLSLEMAHAVVVQLPGLLVPHVPQLVLWA